MKILKHVNLERLWNAFRRLSLHSFTMLKPVAIALMLLMMGGVASFASSVTLKTGDGVGTSSFTGSTNWSNGAVSSAGNAYFTGNLNGGALRTTNYAVNAGLIALTFGGDSLSIDSGGRFIGKIGNNGTAGQASTGIYTANYILNGGLVDEAAGVNGNDVLVLAGTVTVNANSFLGASGATANNSANYETLEIQATISGSANLQVSGTNVNAGADTGTVKLSAANPYSGIITVPISRANSGSVAVIASAVNRMLQLNNLNAVSNATLNLTTTNINPVSFASAVNSGPFNLGALTGNSPQALSDTAGNAVVLSVGANNVSTTYSGVLAGNGSLTKVGTGALILSGTNTYSGSTTISGGTLALGNAGSVSSADIVVASGATFDVSSNAFTLANGQNLLSSGTVNGPVAVASGGTVSAGLSGVYATNTFTTNLTFSTGANVSLGLGATYNGANDLIVVNGNLVLNNATFVLSAPSTSVNLDQTADYVLMTVAGTITGIPNATPIWSVQPQNANHYSIMQSGNNIVLHYNSTLLPSGYGSASPNPAVNNQGVLIAVTVTYSSTPISSVTVNASALGGSSSLPLVSAGNGTYTNTVVVGSGIPTGTASLTAIITDSSSPTPLAYTTPPFTVTITTAAEVWNGGGSDDNWSSNPNWQSGSAPGYVGDALTFAGTTRLTPDMNANYNITGLTFDGSAGDFVLGSSGGYVLTLNGDITDNSSATQTLNLSITNAGNIIHVYGNNNMTINGGIAGAGGLENDVNATLMLNGTNAFTGGININNGELQIGTAGLLGGTNGIYAGAITNNNVFQYSGSATQTLSGAISSYGDLWKDGSGKLVLAGNNTYYGDTYISNGVFQLAGTLISETIHNSYSHNIIDYGTYENSSAGIVTLTGTISGTGNLVQDGSGTLNINGANNTYSGNTVANGGALVYSPNTIGYSTPINNLIINAGGSVVVNVNNGSSLPVGNLTLNSNGVLKLNYTFSGGNPGTAALAVSGSITSLGTNTVQINGFGAVIGQFPLISYTGAPLPNLNNLMLVLPPGLSGNLVNNTASNSIDLNITASSPATWIPLTANDASGTSSFTNGANWQSGSVPAAGNGYYTQGYVLRSPANSDPYTFGGSALSIDQYGFGGSGGRLLLKGSGGAIITVTNLILNGGLLDYANSADTGIETFAGNILLNNGTTGYLGALAGPGYSETLLVTAPISGGGNLQIGGNNVNAGADIGVVEMNAANTYSGSTTVATGTLLVNGSVASSTVTVLTNATLGGSGSINGAVAVQSGGTLTAGVFATGALTNTIGALTVNGAVSVSGIVVLKIDRDTIPNSDELVASGLAINAGGVLTVNNISSTSLAAGDKFTLFSAPVSGAFSVTNLPALPGSSLAWTNRLAVDGTLAVVSTAVGPSGPGVLTNSFSAGTGTLSLSWPANQGWRLQVQTNSLSQGLGTNWIYVTDGTISSTNINVNATNGCAFYRLTYP